MRGVQRCIAGGSHLLFFVRNGGMVCVYRCLVVQ